MRLYHLMANADEPQFDVLLPRENAQPLLQSLADGKGSLQYARVNMKLSELVSGDFFNDYMKIGNLHRFCKRT